MRGFSQISTVFDHDTDSPHRILYSSSIHNTLTKLLPSHFFLEDDIEQEVFEEFLRLLPVVKWEEWRNSGHQVSIYLLCPHRINGSKFFYEMISRWLMPGKRLNISSFFATDFKFFELSDDLFTLCTIVISFKNSIDRELAWQQMPIIESEIKLGLTSVYHANRILEIKGLSADEMTSLIQERISFLLERRPKDFDYDLFAQMQHFLVMCREEFKSVRESMHMSRIIFVFYFFRKNLKMQMEKTSGQRFVYVKLRKTTLHLPFGLKKVLGIFAALNFQGENELFEQRHLISVLKNRFPHLEIIEDSFFFRTFKEERIQLLYLEVEKQDRSDFSLLEMKEINENLPDEIRNGIEKLTRPLFMPRNEEEVMRNIITLSCELKSPRDLPQVIIAFDEQTESELSYTVICLRVRKETDLSLQEIFEKNESFLKFSSDRIKNVGLLRKKHLKEATVFRVQFAAYHFLRSDHSVDLFKARQALVQELQRVLGEYRDYNGGMIAKQYEQFLMLKSLFSHLDKNEELLLENFFHSIFPIEMRSVFNPHFLKNLILAFLRAVQKGNLGIDQKLEEGYCHVLLSYSDPAIKEMIVNWVRAEQIPSSQLLMMSTTYFEISHLGFIYLEEDKERLEIFLRKISTIWENLTFEGVTRHTLIP